MIHPPAGAFTLEEADHLTRIHLKLALEDVGFTVTESDTTIRLDVEPAIDRAADGCDAGEHEPVHLA